MPLASEMTSEERASAIRDYLASNRSKVVEISAKIVELVSVLSDEDRRSALSGVSALYCEHCGGERVPCQCWNDE